MIPASHLLAIYLIVERTRDSCIDWAVVGSTGMALQGVPLEVHDLDIQTDREGAYRLAELFTEHAVTPVRYVASDRIRSHLGEYELAGVKVEIMGALEKLVNGVWEQPVDIREHRHWLEVNGLVVPVLDLEYEVEAYTQMGRTERAALLRAWLADRV
ncbi:hypothetical protein TFLX_05277 [Thermoflexales bacterium]|nr:hypothetical protein TFLX_05277 [Thermoflexales bacterium]